MGIDPGIKNTGYGIIKYNKGNIYQYIDSDNIKTSPNINIELRLSHIFSNVTRILELHVPDLIAIEKLFAGKSVRSAIVLAYSRAAVLIACGIKNIPIKEFNPTKVKKYLSGYGFATKDQISFIVQKLLNVKNEYCSHETDALAIAVCAALEYRSELNKGGLF